MKDHGLEITVRSESKLIKIMQIEDIKIDFVDYSSVIWLEPAVLSDGLRLAGLKDIGAMKISAILSEV